MEKFVKIKICIQDSDHELCSKECEFLDDYFEQCRLFNSELNSEFSLCAGIDIDIYFRCKNCLEQEINNETQT